MAELYAGIADDATASPVVRHRRRRARRAGSPGRERRRRGPGPTDRRAHDRSARHDRLHLGHDRTTQGLCDHARQPAHERAAEPRRGALDARTRRGQPRVPAAGAHAAEDHRPRRCPSGASSWRSPPTSRISRRSWRWSGRRWSSRCHGCSRRSSTARSTRPMPKATAASSTSRSKSPSAGPRTTQPGGHHPITGLEHAALERLVYRKLQAVFGGRMRFAVSGGGPLGERLTHFFNGIGVKIFEGYGLTETSPTLTVNRADAWKPGTVGTPLAATSIRIADDGEILAKGPQVFQGYWHNEARDRRGVRRRRMVPDRRHRDARRRRLPPDHGSQEGDSSSPPSGKNVAPAPLEDRLRAHPLISEAVVVGDARPFIAALITLDPEARHQVGDPARPRRRADVGLGGERRPAGGHPVRSRRRNRSVSLGRIDPGVRVAARGTRPSPPVSSPRR